MHFHEHVLTNGEVVADGVLCVCVCVGVCVHIHVHVINEPVFFYFTLLPIAPPSILLASPYISHNVQ